MSKFSKFKDILAIGSALGKPFIPGGVNSILDKVNSGLADKTDPANEKAITDLAKDNDEQTTMIEQLTQAVLVMNDRIKVLESK